MSTLFGQFWAGLGSALFVPLLLAVALALLIGLTRLASSIRYVVRHRGLLPAAPAAEPTFRLSPGTESGLSRA